MLVCCQHCSNKQTLKDKRSIRKAQQASLYTCPACKKRITERKSLKSLPIDWDNTLAIYGHTLETLPYHSKIVITCANCNKPLSIVYRGPKTLSRQIGKATHKKCFRLSPEAQDKSKKASADYWSDPRSRELASELMAGRWRDPAYRKAVTDALLANDDSFVSWDYERHSKESKLLWADADYRRKMLNFLQTKQRQLMIELWADDNYREHMAQTAFWNPQPSKLQRRLIPIFDMNDIVWLEEFRIRFWHFDYCLPEYNTLIEVQGNYWHSKPEAIARDKRKRTFVYNNTEYDLVEVWEDEFKNRELLNEKIKSLKLL